MMTKSDVEGTLHNWHETKLWNRLKGSELPEAEAVRTTLNRWMPTIHEILAHAGTAPADFTLHDSQHAFRVAERMVEIMPGGVLEALSTYELALLLLSAYLHDIGMVPEQRLLTSLYDYILDGEEQELSKELVEDFLSWLDETNEPVAIPVSAGKPESKSRRQAGLLLAHYVRARHVEWSEAWIEKHLAGEKLGTYSSWVVDLKALCRSHHEGYKELIEEDFDPEVIGSKALVVHLRYLAAVLRVADVLEFDPERTPPVVFQHRDVDPKSAIYWHKDHHVTRQLKNRRLTISARPPDARIHRAIEQMIDDIEAELQLVRRLDDERPFEVSSFQEEPLPHRWDILPNVRRGIRPKGNAYEYIDGAFRPDTRKLLQLLSGKELYGDEMVAVRELLQNALDAVREQIAYERLAQVNPADPQLEEKLGDLHHVELRLETIGDEIWLVCTDDGVGMTKAIIRDYLLVSGMARHRDVRKLERRCEASGFRLERTGQFGIGVLSYFMLADMVQICTKRNRGPGDDEQTGWVFETEGIGSFGELRQDAAIQPGTQVRLRLKPAGLEALTRWAQRRDDPASRDGNGNRPLQEAESGTVELLVKGLEVYVRQTLQRVPCKVRLVRDLPNHEVVTLGPGWTHDATDWSQLSFPRLLRQGKYFNDETDMSLLPAHQREQRETRRRQVEAEQAYLRALPQEITECLTWETTTGELPDNLGHFRIHLPVFQLSAGPSPFFLPIEMVEGRIIVHQIGNFEIFRPASRLFMSWKGMTIQWLAMPEDREVLADESRGAVIEVDWLASNAGSVSVSRKQMRLSADAERAMAWLKEQVREALNTAAGAMRGSTFAVLADILAAKGTPVEKDTWLFRDPSRSGEAIWGPIQFPALSLNFTSFYSFGTHLEWDGQPVSELHNLAWSDWGGTRGTTQFSFADPQCPPSRS